MKKIFMLAIALCIFGAGGSAVFSQTSGAQKSAKRKLVRCRVNGKIVYRNGCRTKRKSLPKLVAPVKTMVSDELYELKPYNSTGELQRYEELRGTGTGSGTGSGSGSGTGQGTGQGNGNGLGNGAGNASPEKTESSTPTATVKRSANVTQSVKFISIPKPSYTDAARKNKVEGKVSLRITFLADGTIGAITPVRGLPDGLTQQAIEAARGIRFEPATRKGVPVSTTRLVEFNFSIY